MQDMKNIGAAAKSLIVFASLLYLIAMTIWVLDRLGDLWIFLISLSFFCYTSGQATLIYVMSRKTQEHNHKDIHNQFNSLQEQLKNINNRLEGLNSQLDT